MAIKTIDDKYLTNIAAAIRTKNGSISRYTPTQMANAILDIPTSSSSKYAPRQIQFQLYTGFDLDYEIENLDTSNLENMDSMFFQCTYVTSLDLSAFDTSNVTSMYGVFYYCNNLKTLNISSFNTSKVDNMSYMFNNCLVLTSLNLSHFDTSNVINMSYMFSNCRKLANLNISNFNTAKVTNMANMFYNCYVLTSLDISHFDTSSSYNINNMFYYCRALKTLSEFGGSAITTLTGTFTGCTVLENFGGIKDLGQAFSTTQAANYSSYTLTLSPCSQLTHDSLMNVINNLYDIKTKGCNTQKLVLGTTNLAKLTADEIAIATNKGWTVS